MTTVPVHLHRDLRVEEQRKHALLSGAWKAALLGVAGIAVIAIWIAAFFFGILFLANFAR